MPRVASIEPPPVNPARDHRRRQRLDRRQRGTRGAVAGVRVIDAAPTSGSRGRTTSASARAIGGLVLLLNSDTIVPAGTIDRLVAELERDPTAAVASDRGWSTDAAAPSCRSANDRTGQRDAPEEARGQVNGDVDSPTASWNAAATPCDWVSGACLLVRRSDAEAVGLLDERYFMYTEDVDFCAAIRARGRTVLFTPDVEIVHLRGRSAAAASAARRRRAYRRSRIAFYEKHHPAWRGAARCICATRDPIGRTPHPMTIPLAAKLALATVVVVAAAVKCCSIRQAAEGADRAPGGRR